MPLTNPLSFLRPLYDIALWQYILMSGIKREECDGRLKFSWKMHEVVANFLCKLLEVRAFEHLKSKLTEEEVKAATGDWEVGQRATKRLVEWCQDQWRRKEPILPHNQIPYTVHEPATVPWFDNIPLCHRCGVPCPSCREELASDLPSEMSTAQAIVCFDAIHEDRDLLVDLDNDDDDGITSSKEEEPPFHASPMQLRSRKRK